MKAFTRYLCIQDSLSDFVGRVISVFSLVMVFILLYEVIMRYFMRSPTIWAHELTTMIFGSFSILAGSYTLRYQSHVRSEVLWGILPPKLQAFCDIVVFSLGLIVLLVLFRLSLDFVARSWAANEYSSRSVWQPPLYYLKAIIPIAVGLLILQSIAELGRALFRCLGVDFHDPRTDSNSVEHV